MAHSPHYHVFIPGLFAPLKLWQRDFAFQPESAALLRLLADYQPHVLPLHGLERSVLHCLGMRVSERLPWAGLRHAFESSGMYQPPLMCADPVHLQTGSDAIMLNADAPLLNREETELLLSDLNRHLAQDGLALKAFHPERWYLHSLDERFNRPLPLTTPLSEVGAGNIFPKLPQSDDKYWHQLMNEIQMLLHTHRVNQAREAAGQLPVNGVWFWGEDATDNMQVDSLIRQSVIGVQGGNLSGQVIASAAKANWQQQVDSSLAAVPDSGEVLVILDQLQSFMVAEQPQLWQQVLSKLDDYFIFLHELLQAGGGVSLYDTAGQMLLCQRIPGWQFWRRKQADWREFIR